MKKRFFIGLLLLLFCKSLFALELTQEEMKYIQNKKVIYVSNQLDWFPYDFNDNGVAKGYSVDYIKSLAQKVGLRVEFLSQSWQHLLQNLDNNTLDILMLAQKNSNREIDYIFSKNKIIDMKYSFITKSSSVIPELENNKELKVALVKSWASTDSFKKQYPNLNVIEFKNSLEALEAVAFGVADMSVNDYYTAMALINDNMLSNLIVHPYRSISLKPMPLYIMAKKENQILINILNKAADGLVKQELLDIKSKWVLDTIKQANSMSFSKDEKEYLEKKQIIKMCIDPDWMPLEKNDNGKHIGMTSDYFKILEEQIGFPIQMVETKTWSESIEFAKARKCDIYSLAMPTPERKLYMDFTKPYLKIPLVLVTRNNEIFYSDISAIKDKKIGVVKGYAYGEILHVKYPNMQLVQVENLIDGLEKVEKHKLFGVIGTLATVGYNIQKSYLGSLQITGKFDENWELGVGTRNDEPLLLNIFNKAIDSIDITKQQEILNRWISVNYERPVDYTFIWKIVGIVIFVFLFIIYRQYELRKYNHELKKLSQTDSLTSLYNRLKLDDILEYEIKNYLRYENPLSIVLVDIDDFKLVNDKFGHGIGDEFLKEFSKLLKDNMRSTDSVGRWGGEEFLIILPQSDLEGAHKLAQKLKEKIENYTFTNVGKKTASFGVAQYDANESKEALFDRVDKALYISKSSGKNRVTIDL